MECSATRDCAVIISTCDKYADILNPFFTLFSKFWSDNPYPVYVNSETLDCSNKNVHVKTLKARVVDLSWTRRLKEAMERVETDYIIFMLDDFFLYDNVDTARIEECLSYMRKDPGIAGIYFSTLDAFTQECALPGLEQIKYSANCKVNLTLALFRKSVFLYYLDHDESAWEFEANSLGRSLERSETFYSFSASAHKAIPYDYQKYGLISGKWFKPTADLFREHGIIYDFSARGFYEEYELGLIPYIARQIKMDSYLVPCYSLERDNPRINTEKVIEEGYFSQRYDVSDSRSAVIWYPSNIYGYAIENFKCTITYKSGADEILGCTDVYGSFTLYRGGMYFLKWGVYVYILAGKKQEMACVTIEGYMNKHLDRSDLVAAYSQEVRVAPTGFKGLFDRSRIYAETLLLSESFASFRIYSKLCFRYNSKFDEENKTFDGKDRFPGQFLQIYKVDKSADNIVRWDIGGTFGGYAIEGLKVEMIYDNNESHIMEELYIKGDGVSVDRYWVFLSPNANLLLTLPEELPDEIRISGIVLAPMPRRVLRAVIYAEDLENTVDELDDDQKTSQSQSETKDKKKQKRYSCIDQNDVRYILARAKRGIKKYGVLGLIKEVLKRLVHRRNSNFLG